MAKSFEITKVSIRERLVVDAKVGMKDPQDYDFSPRANLSGTTLSIVNESGEPSSTFELDEEQVITAERDRMLELRVKFNVEGMHATPRFKCTITANFTSFEVPESEVKLPIGLLGITNQISNTYFEISQ